VLSIKVLGSGCPNCKKVEEIARRAASEIGIAAAFEKITDYAAIAAHDVLSTPGLMIEGKLVSSGRIPSQAEITTWLADAVQHR
jgi:small redox-active disulfide protein 2